MRKHLVTGSNKGIGLATVKALCEAVGSESIVYLTARSVERGTKAVEDLAKSGLKPRFHPLDVDDASSIETFATFLKKEHGGLDVLVNNAAIAYKNSAYGASKVGVSALTRIQQRMLDQDPRDDIVVNHCHPGYVDTDMTSHRGVLTVEQGAVCPTYLALLPPNVSSPRGEYLWYDKQVVDWVDASLPPP
ncbi:hypothetical protein HAZT_HAZT008227, partial [Hyalella azteca]